MTSASGAAGAARPSARVPSAMEQMSFTFFEQVHGAVCAASDIFTRYRTARQPSMPSATVPLSPPTAAFNAPLRPAVRPLLRAYLAPNILMVGGGGLVAWAALGMLREGFSYCLLGLLVYACAFALKSWSEEQQHTVATLTTTAVAAPASESEQHLARQGAIIAQSENMIAAQEEHMHKLFKQRALAVILTIGSVAAVGTGVALTVSTGNPILGTCFLLIGMLVGSYALYAMVYDYFVTRTQVDQERHAEMQLLQTAKKIYQDMLARQLASLDATGDPAADDPPPPEP